MIDWNDYAASAMRTAVDYPGRGMKLGLLYTTLGLRGESGEVVEQAKKLLRDDHTAMTDARRQGFLGELGDVCWYAAAVASEARLSLGYCRIKSPLDASALDYPLRGSEIGLCAASARLHSACAKVGDFALTVMSYAVADGEHWYDVSQGRRVRGLVATGLGQVMFWVGAVAEEAGFTLDLTLRTNLAKFASRKDRGVLHGDGSTR